MIVRSPFQRHLAALPVGLLCAASVGSAASGCSEQPINVEVRSLEQSGDVAFLCLSWGDKANPGRSLEGCGVVTDETADPGEIYGLVTQLTRGEVAVTNISTEEVKDLDPSKPGFNFLPIGANPVDIVATPGGTAAFVGSAAANRESIWVLPSKTIVAAHPSLTSFAACALPAAPGKMMMLVDSSSESSENSESSDDAGEHPNGDLSLETHDPGPRKLLVSLPELGSLVLIDAQEILDRPAGSFEACPMQWIPLEVDLPPAVPRQRTPDGGFPPGVAADGSACVFTERPELPIEATYTSRPAGMALDAQTDRLYVADEDAPVIHVLDVSSLPDIRELSPLLPVSASRPERVVISRDVAVSPTTTAGKKYLYATDLLDGSVMVFDISLDSTDRTPLIRPYPQRNPFQSRDRLGFSAPVRDIEFVLRDSPEPDPNTGATPVGLACNPEDDGAVGAQYRTSGGFDEGAGPGTLRGVFAVLGLTNGQLAIVDVDDFDAPCRRPKASKKGTCENEDFASYEGASGELSCNMVVPHQARSRYFIHADDQANGRIPGLQTFPVLSQDTEILPTDQTDEGLAYPKLLAPIPEPGQQLEVGGRMLETEDIQFDPAEAEKNTVLFDLTAPRVHIDQNWSITFEGALPGFNRHVGRFDATSGDKGRTTFHDAGAFFCDRGVHDLGAARAVAADRGISSEADVQQWAAEHVDVLHISEGFLDEEDLYWDSVAGRCSWLQCRETFGVVRDPKRTRDLPIVEAYQGSLVVEGVYDRVRCCFPSLVSYEVRPRNQWVVTGSSFGFLHHVEPDPATGRCVDSCDPTKALLRGRAHERAREVSIPAFGDPEVFRNPLLQFVLWSGRSDSERGMAFEFQAKDGFSPLLINLAASTYINPQSLDLAPTGELVIADGAQQGLVFVSLGSLGVSGSIF